MVLPPYFDASSYDSGNKNSFGAAASSNSAADNIEKKYVNSGQSVLLVCDLPNNMPDGKVSSTDTFYFILNIHLESPAKQSIYLRKEDIY